MRKRLLSILQFILFFGFGVFLVWWSISRMGDAELENCKLALRSARYVLLVPVFFIMVLSHVSRAIRWKIMMRSMGYKPSLLNTFFAVMVGYLVNLAVPRLGEVAKCTVLNRYEKLPVDKLIGTIIVERAVDAVSLCIVFIIAIITQADVIGSYAKKTVVDNFFSGSIESFLVKSAILVLVIIGGYFGLRTLFRKYSDRGFIHKLRSGIKGIGIGLRSVTKMENKWAFIFHSLLIWSCYILGTYVGFFAISSTAHLPFAAVFPVLAFASVGMIITPGGIGSYAYFISGVMVLYGIERGLGYANGTLQWLAQFAIILLIGFLSLLILPYYNKNRKHAQHTGDTAEALQVG